MPPYESDATTAALSDLPDGWAVTTRQPNHLAFLQVGGDSDGRRRSVAVQPSGGPAATNGWSAMGVAGYEPTCPRLARGESLTAAVAAAKEEMAAVNRGEPSEDHAEGVAVVGGTGGGSEPSSSAATGDQGDGQGEAGQGGDEQAALDEWL